MTEAHITITGTADGFMTIAMPGASPEEVIAAIRRGAEVAVNRHDHPGPARGTAPPTSRAPLMGMGDDHDEGTDGEALQTDSEESPRGTWHARTTARRGDSLSLNSDLCRTSLRTMNRVAGVSLKARLDTEEAVLRAQIEQFAATLMAAPR